MGSESGSDGSMGDFLDDFASDSDDGEIAAEAADDTRSWTQLTAPSDSAAAAAVAHAARDDRAARAAAAGGGGEDDEDDEDDEDAPWRKPTEPEPEPALFVGDCAISPLAATIAALDGAAARSLLAERPDACSAQAQEMLLQLCDGDYLAVLSSAPARSLLCLGQPLQDGAADAAAGSGEELRLRGNELYKAAEYVAAAEAYSTAARKFRDEADAEGGREKCLLNRAACYLQLGHSLAAVADCNAVLLAQPESVKALFRRGQAFASIGNMTRAKEDLTAAAKLSPKDAGVRSALTDCKTRLKADGAGSSTPRNELAYIREVVRRVAARTQGCSFAEGADQTTEDEVVCLCTAAALLLVFVKANWTGAGSAAVTGSKLSDLSCTPGQQHTGTGTGNGPLSLELDGEQMGKAGLGELTVDGETASVNARCTHCLLLSQAMLQVIAAKAGDGLRSAAMWWAGRSMTVHQRLLEDCPSNTLDTAVLRFYKEVTEAVAGAGVSFARKCTAINGRDLEALAHLELAVYAYETGQRPLYRDEAKNASRASGVEYKLDGVMGVRTKYQTVKKAQLIIRHTSSRGEDQGGLSLFAGAGPKAAKVVGDQDSAKGLPAQVALDDDTLLPEVRLEEEDPNLEALPVDQAIIMLGGMAVQMLEKVDETLRNEQLRAYTRLLTAQESTLWCIRATALWQRSKIETYKRRTMPRALEQLRSLVKAAGFRINSDAADDQAPLCNAGEGGVNPREAMFFGVPAAPRWIMQREEAMGYCKEGIFEQAAEIFLDIQAWHEVIDSYTAANEVLKAENIVRTRLSVEPSPRLWCALGELCERSRVGHEPVPNDSDDATSCYKHALGLDPRYGHAHRCLAKLAWAEDRFEDVIMHLEAALAINPMSTPSWYTLGCTALRLKRWAKARTAFTRFLTAEPDDGEAHANLAVALIHLDQKKQAYTVLSDAVRHAWGNGKIWQNYGAVAIDTDHFNTAARVLERLISLKLHKQAIDISALRVLMTVVESNGDIQDADGVSPIRLHQKVQVLLEKLLMLESGKESISLHEISARFHHAMAATAAAAAAAAIVADGRSAPEQLSDSKTVPLSAAVHRQRRAVGLARQLELISRFPGERLEAAALNAFAELAATAVDAMLEVAAAAPGAEAGAEEPEVAIVLLTAQVRTAMQTIRQNSELITKEGAGECFVALEEQLARLPEAP